MGKNRYQDGDIRDVAEALLFYEEYDRVTDYLEKNRELWVSEENYLQLNEVPSENSHNPEFISFIKFLDENNISQSCDRNGHVRFSMGSASYAVWPYCTQLRIEKWCAEGIPLTYYYTGKEHFYVIVVDEDGRQYKLSAEEAVKKVSDRV